MASNKTKLTFWGVRGSTPSTDRGTWRYGGNTPSVELTTNQGSRFILDCGTGMRMLGNRWASLAGDRSIEADIFVTHYHWDHIQGLPFFTPLYSPRNKFRFHGFGSSFVGPDSLKRVFEAQMAPPYFPVGLNSMFAAREFVEMAGSDHFTVGDTCVRARWLNHPQGCLGLRFETPAGTIVYATDNEPGIPEFDRALVELSEGADILINDAQYTPQQLETRKGWGHSTWLAGVQTAKSAGVRNLVLFHHDPDSSDAAVDAILRDARGQFENVWVATEGMAMTLEGGKMEVAVPTEAEIIAGDTHFRARVTGHAYNGRAFEEETLLRNMSVRGALIYLPQAPKLQSELQVTIENNDSSTLGKHLRGHVVRVEAGENGQIGVEIVFSQ